MKAGSVRALILRISILIISGFLLIAASTKKNDVEFDFKKTIDYFHLTLVKRPDFPVSVTFMHNYTFSALALGDMLDPKRRESIINFAKKTQKSDGGFSLDSRPIETSALYTDYAVETLYYLNAVNSINVAKAKSFLSSLMRSDGGFAFDTKTKKADFETTYFAVHSLSILNGLDIVDKAKTSSYIKGFEKKNTGGFSYAERGIANSKDTYMGVYVLKALGMLDERTRKNAVKYLASTPFVGKFGKSKVYHSMDLEEEAYTLMALRILGGEGGINKDMVVSFIRSFYIPETGGFSPMLGYGSAPHPTYWGVMCLAELGVLKGPIEGRVK
jgi:hypothetical protein